MAENNKPEKPTLTGLARRLGQLPADKKRAALETSAALAGVSLRVSREFVEAVPKAAKVLSADDLRNWGEFGRRLAMGNADSGVKFFADGVDGLKKIPKAARAAVFQVCSRQLVLSSSIALETFHLIPVIAAGLADRKLLANILNLAVEIAQRSAKHSADFLEHTPAVARALDRFGVDSPAVADAVLTLAADFASRTGGLTADLWHELPTALASLTAPNAVALMESSAEFLEYGGSVTLHFVASGSKVLTLSERAFDDWRASAREIARHGNAVLIAFLRATPKLFDRLAGPKCRLEPGAINRVLLLTKRIAETDAESALAAFKSSAAALQKVSVEQFEEWVDNGLIENVNESTKARRSYFALETRASNERLQKVRLGLSLENIQPVLRMYIEALTGK
ncbi:MAG: hypothetical protein KA831_08720, partial [Pyrinomonadaceae bacterium]|nr:hypothetical protein [Pyrinomonadaceae bacterium]